MALSPLPPGNTQAIVSSFYFPNFKEPSTTRGVTQRSVTNTKQAAYDLLANEKCNESEQMWTQKGEGGSTTIYKHQSVPECSKSKPI